MQETSLLWLDIVEKCIKERRTVRSFREKDIEKKKMIKILEAGNWAPSAGNLHSRYFVVVQSASEKKRIMECVQSNRIKESGKKNLMKAPLFIIVCADFKKCRTKYKGRKGTMFGIQDAAVAVQNMSLISHALGLGTCWVGNFDEAKIISVFNLRKGLYPTAILAIGYPAYIPPPPKRFAIEEITRFDSEANPGNSIYKPQEGHE